MGAGRYSLPDADDIAEHLEDGLEAEFGTEDTKTDAIDPLIHYFAATEAQLRDYYADLLGMERHPDETDREFRERIKAEVVAKGGDVPSPSLFMTDDKPETFDPESSPFDISVADDGVDVDEMVEASEGVDMPGLAEGLDPELSRDLKEITKDTGRTHATTIKARSGDFMDAHSKMSESTKTRGVDFDAFEVEIQHEQVNALLKTIYERLQEVSDEYGHPDELVLGMPQYAVLEPWAQAEHNESIEDTLPVDEITVVDGPMIHPVVPNAVMLTEYLREKDGE